MATRKPVGQGGKQQAARRTTAKKKVNDAAKAVKAAREEGQSMEVSSVADFKKSSARKPVLLKLPSGHVCEAINKGFQTFAMEGGIPNPLMPMIMEAVNSGKGLPTDSLATLASDENAIVHMMQMVDNVVVSSVTSPVIHPKPALIENPEDPEGDKIEPPRDPELLYVDELDIDDKMFVMQWFMGGVKDLERFRDQQAVALAALQSSKELGEDAK